MSSDTTEPISFSCPNCQKRLKAPSKLAGQKLACPKCQAQLRVPGIVALENQDDEWLSLDADPAAPEIVNAKPPAGPPSTTATPKPTPANADVDEFQLAPLEANGTVSRNSKPVSEGMPVSEKASSTQRSVFDDDLPDLMPIDAAKLPPPVSADIFGDQPPAKKPAKPTGPGPRKPAPKSKAEPLPFPDAGLPDMALPDIELPDFPDELSQAAPNSNAKPKGKPLLSGSLEQLSMESAAADFSVPQVEEFRFACKVCGTFLYESESRVGQKTQCPDCHSEFRIPKPPVKKKQNDIKLDEGPGVTFAPITSQSVRNQDSSKNKSDEILERAAEAVERERKEIDDVSGSFDSKRWISLIFGFLRDPMVIVAAVGIGVASAAWYFAISAAPGMMGLEGTPAILVSIGLFLVFCIPIYGATCMCGLSILTMAANRSPKVTEWPFLRIGESIGECAMVLATIMIGSIPGGMIGALTNVLGAHPMIMTGFTLIGIWGVAPILLLCMIDNGSIFEPYSKGVFKSIRQFSDAWGAMYMQSGLAFFAIWSLIFAAIQKDSVGDVILGLLSPFVCFFIFNQYGVLAGRISSVTEMGFEGDFSED